MCHIWSVPPLNESSLNLFCYATLWRQKKDFLLKKPLVKGRIFLIKKLKQKIMCKNFFLYLQMSCLSEKSLSIGLDDNSGLTIQFLFAICDICAFPSVWLSFSAFLGVDITEALTRQAVADSDGCHCCLASPQFGHLAVKSCNVIAWFFSSTWFRKPIFVRWMFRRKCTFSWKWNTLRVPKRIPHK